MEKKLERPLSTYVAVWLVLLVLTAVTVTVAGLDLGQWSVFGAIFIALVKAALVLLFFMHIKYEDRVFKAMLSLAVVTLTVIMVLTFMDISYR